MLEALAAESGARLILNEVNSGYSGGMNLGLRHTSAPLVAVLNPDLHFFEGSIEALVAEVQENPRCGVSGPMGFYDLDRAVALPPNPLPDLLDHWRQVFAHLGPVGARRYAKRRARESYAYWTLSRPTPLPMLSGCCMVFRREVLAKLGGLFDERFPLYYEDADFYRRVGRAGLECVLVPDAHIVHYYGRSSSTDDGESMRRYHVAQDRYYRKWYGALGYHLGYRGGKRFLDWWPAGHKKRPPAEPVDLGPVTRPPSIEVPIEGAFYLELSMDPMFFLGGGIVRTANPFRFSERTWESIGELRYYLRAVEVATMETIRVWSFERVPEPARVPAEAGR